MNETDWPSTIFIYYKRGNGSKMIVTVSSTKSGICVAINNTLVANNSRKWWSYRPNSGSRYTCTSYHCHCSLSLCVCVCMTFFVSSGLEVETAHRIGIATSLMTWHSPFEMENRTTYFIFDMRSIEVAYSRHDYLFLFATSSIFGSNTLCIFFSLLFHSIQFGSVFLTKTPFRPRWTTVNCSGKCCRCTVIDSQYN